MIAKRNADRYQRSGAAAVEFAVVAPLLFVVVMGAIEFGRAMMTLELLSHAARQGARTGILSGSSNSTITTAVNNSLTDSGITGANAPTIKVNGQSVDASTATTGDQITVTVSVLASNITWLPVSWFLGNSTLSQTVVMRRE